MRYHMAAFLGGFLLDLILGDPCQLPHPVRFMGAMITKIEKKILKPDASDQRKYYLGIWMVLLVLGGTAVVSAAIQAAGYGIHPWAGTVVEMLMTYQILAARCLEVESMKVYKALKEGNTKGARQAVSMIVGRDTALLDEEGIAKAAIETVAENTSDGVIAPGYEPEALEMLKAKKKGAYNVIQIDESYVPAPTEVKQVYGISFEQGRNELKIDDAFFDNIVTKEKNLPKQAKIDLAIAMITLKYTQSNSVCYVKDGQAIGIGAGQQSRIHCTRLAGTKADNWFLRQSPMVLDLQFVDGIGRADRDNSIDLYIGEDYMDVLADGTWQKIFKVKPEVFTADEKRAWLDQMSGVALGSDAFFPFGDNIERAHRSGVQYVAQPGGSVRDDNVIGACDKYGMTMCFTGIRLFHH